MESALRRSAQLTLVLIASLSVGACGNGEARQTYRSREDCLKDWLKPDLCEGGTASSYYGPRTFIYNGNLYYRTRTNQPFPADPEAPAVRAWRATGSLNSGRALGIARGGFGGSARFGGGG